MQKIFTVVFSANAKCVLIEIWTTSSSILSRGGQFESSNLGNFFLPLFNKLYIACYEGFW